MNRWWAVVWPAGLLLAVTARANDRWPQFRGPGASGLSDESALPDAWNATDNIAWKTAIAGRGWSSPVVWNGRVFLTTAESQKKPPVAKKGLYIGGERGHPPDDIHRWKLLCLQASTGKLLWERTAHEGVPTFTTHIKNSYSSETPTTDGERVYAYFGNVGIFAYDFAGNLVWSQMFGPFKSAFGWGTASSPVIHAGRLYVLNDNQEKSFLLCLDAKTGREIWRVARDEKSDWTTPCIWEANGRTEIVTAAGKRVRAYDLDGRVLWELAGMSYPTIPTPFAAEGLLYVSSGYIMDRVRPVYAIRPSATGDITLKKTETSNAGIAWAQRTAGPYNPTPIVYRGLLYVLKDGGMLACYDAKSGRVVYEPQRLGKGANAFTASPWAYDGKVFCLSEDGDTFVVEAGPHFRVLRKNPLGEMCLATPAVAGGRLFIRTQSQLYAIGASSGAASAAERR